jgi:choice-of-anchor B domain-containing protein
VIADLSGLPNHLVWHAFKPMVTLDGVTDSIVTSHTVFISDDGYMYLNGSNRSQFHGGGTLMFNLNVDPDNPPFVGAGQAIYAHDCYARGNRLYTADIYNGTFSVYDITNRANPIMLTQQQTPSRFCHNMWLSDDGRILYTTDETAEAVVAAYDVSDEGNITELDRYRHAATEGKRTIPHNVYVVGNYLMLSYYTNGVVMIDAHRHDNLVEVAQYDTWNGADGGFHGCWGVYPFFRSGIVIGSNIEDGEMYVMRATYGKGAFLQGRVTNVVTGNPVSGARAQFLTHPESPTNKPNKFLQSAILSGIMFVDLPICSSCANW